MCRLSADQMGGTTTSTVDVTTKSITTVGAICWTYWYSALITQILTPKSYHRLGLIDIFCVCLGIDCNILEQIAIWGVRSVPNCTHSASEARK